MATYSLTSVDKILPVFALQSVPDIVGEPDYNTISDLANATKTNAAALPAGT